MKREVRLLLLLALAHCTPLLAEQAATVTRGASLRAGPDRNMPMVTTLLSGSAVNLVGCVSNWSWCDVIAGRERGWFPASYLSVRANGTAVSIAQGGPNLGLPVVDFVLGPYWDEHYQRRIWYPQKASWQMRWDERREPPVWREPTPAPARQ